MSENNMFHWLPRTLTIKKKKGNAHEEVDVVIVGIKDIQNNIIYPHPISNFIVKRYRNKGLSYQSQLKATKVLCQFLNFVNRCIDDEIEGYENLKIYGIKSLKLSHGSDFITDGTLRGIGFQTSNYYEQLLTNFYKYLVDLNLIEENIEVHYKTKFSNYGKRPYPISPFNKSYLDTLRPSRNNFDESDNKLKDFGENRNQLVYEFIQEAQLQSNIALGICFQFLAGLRLGEVVNLTIDSIHDNGFRGNGGFYINIKDNQDKLFKYLSNKSQVQVKRPRYNFVLEDPLFWNIYYEHMERLQYLKKQKKITNKYALFYSEANGEALSGESYRRQFVKVKQCFLRKLRENRRYADLDLLESAEWSTHIGRGVYTNFLIDMGLNEDEIANLRGDKTKLSVLKYIEKRTSLEKVKKHVNILTRVYGEGKDIIQEEVIEQMRINLNKWKGLS
ncbi:site-specific integrase [Sutcliffiella horikoshii]|uniref:site-specific integrase n=1 Tax=Sutcliffiella horikoshii TaxID=79883 RepID=UPI0016535FCD|nr:site-specific integrase [Sutcliffiella horikoshii]